MMAEKDARIKKLEKYIPLKESEVGYKFPPRTTKSVAAMDAADLAEGKTPGTSNKDAVDMYTTGRDMGFSEEGQAAKAKGINRKSDKASELADQYKRETRGMAKGGMTASSRADGIAQRGKTKGRMV
jgi:hypothetical protein